MGVDGRTGAIPSAATILPATARASGGGTDTYASWGFAYAQAHGVQPPTADGSMVYFGNGTGAYWNQDSGSQVLADGGIRNPLAFNADGVALSNITVTPSADSPMHFGTSATPVTLSQTLNDLVPGDRYRLQFWVSGPKAASHRPDRIDL